MKVVEQQALVMHSADEMFSLVNDIKSYPLFLPGCTGASILQQGEGWLEAQLELSMAGFHQRIITRNTMTSNHRIEIELIDGPLSSLNGYWLFTPLGKDACKVYLHLTFAIDNFLLRMTVLPIFEHLASSMVDAFCQRAADLYDQREKS